MSKDRHSEIFGGSMVDKAEDSQDLGLVIEPKEEVKQEAVDNVVFLGMEFNRRVIKELKEIREILDKIVGN